MKKGWSARVALTFWLRKQTKKKEAALSRSVPAKKTFPKTLLKPQREEEDNLQTCT